MNIESCGFWRETKSDMQDSWYSIHNSVWMDCELIIIKAVFNLLIEMDRVDVAKQVILVWFIQSHQKKANDISTNWTDSMLPISVISGGFYQFSYQVFEIPNLSSNAAQYKWIQFLNNTRIPAFELNSFNQCWIMKSHVFDNFQSLSTIKL